VEPSTKTSVSQPIVSSITTDALSGFDHFEIKVVDISPGRGEEEVAFFVEAVSPYQLPALEIGQYMVVIKAFDKAGNWRNESIKIEIIPKGISLTGKGIWFWGMFIPWWLIIIILILISLLIIGLLILWWRTYRQSQKGKKWRLKEGENNLKEFPLKKLSLEDEKIELMIRKEGLGKLIEDILREEEEVEKEAEIIGEKEKETQALEEKREIEMERHKIEQKREKIEKKRWEMEQEREKIINRMKEIE